MYFFTYCYGYSNPQNIITSSISIVSLSTLGSSNNHPQHVLADILSSKLTWCTIELVVHKQYLFLKSNTNILFSQRNITQLNSSVGHNYQFI